jgi:futalosine hydrolase
MKIVITAATKGEWLPSYNAIKTTQKDVLFHESGVGILSSTVALMKLITDEKPDLIIQVGIAGTFDTTKPLDRVVVIKNETIGDLGVTEKGQWKDIFDLQLIKNNQVPFVKKLLPNPWLKQYNLLKLSAVNAVTVNQISTSKKQIEQLIQKYNPTIESMEGAALHYVCLDANIPFLQIRAISNYVGERNKTKWLLKESILNLNEAIIQLLEQLS